MTSLELHVVSNHRSFNYLFNSLCGTTSNKHHSLHYWSFVRGIHRWPVNSPHKGPVTRKKLLLMASSCVRNSDNPSRDTTIHMMTSSNGNMFRVTGPLRAEFTGHRWIPPHKSQWRGALIFSLICAWINGWNNRKAGDLRLHRAHYDVTVMQRLYDKIPQIENGEHPLTHWGRVTHICVSKPTTIGSDDGLSPDRRQGIIWTNAGLLLVGPWGTNFSEIFIEILTFSFK